ncbi:unnamed protein product [Cuscuta europaea]|uniref:Uncharacterized protein n=1 Tax=Cuscuta europaea TaxID=41803 RepID=A0A9P0YYQ3_CUSEU|nr:unnamed protein product [Cuscuta europaea]
MSRRSTELSQELTLLDLSDNKHMSWEEFNEKVITLKASFAQTCVFFLNSASKDDLKKLKGIGDKTAAYIVELRKKSPRYFRSLSDLQKHGPLFSIGGRSHGQIFCH